MTATDRETTQRRWLWLLGGLAVALAIALTVVLVAQGDDSDTASTPTNTTADATTTTTAATTTTGGPTTTAPTTTTIPYPVVTDSPQVYAQYLFAAWQNNSQSAAAQVASADAISQMFQQAYSANAGWQFDDCNPAAGTLYCTWTSASGATLTMQVRTITGGQPIQVVGVTRS